MQAISGVFANVDWPAIWAFVNTPIVCALLPATIAAVLAQRVNLVVQQNEATLDAARATANAQDRLGSSTDPVADNVPSAAPAPEGPSAARAPLSDEDNKKLDAGAALIQKIKDYVDAVANDVRDGRKRRKYNNIPRRDYRVVVLALAEDGAIPSEDASRLNHAFSLWRRFQNRQSPVPDFVLSELRAIEKQFVGRRG